MVKGQQKSILRSSDNTELPKRSDGKVPQCAVVCVCRAPGAPGSGFRLCSSPLLLPLRGAYLYAAVSRRQLPVEDTWCLWGDAAPQLCCSVTLLQARPGSASYSVINP